MRQVFATLAVSAVLIAWPTASPRVSAECITDGQSPKKRLGLYPVVFVGDVLGFESSDQRESLSYRVRFRVIEAFRGAQRVLVYASGTPAQYSTQCTATRVVTSALVP